MGQSNKPILLMAHPRACSTAFSRMFMTQSNQITCFHEPFRDPYHFGPERLSRRFEDEEVRLKSGFSEVTYGMVLENIRKEEVEGKHIFIKEMAKCVMPVAGTPVVPASIARSCSSVPHSEAAYALEPRNPSILPLQYLQGYHFTFLIRHPCLSIPSLYKLTIPPSSNITGTHGFHSEDAGYVELRLLFDYLREVGQIGPNIAGRGRSTANEKGTKGSSNESVEICVIDADSLVKSPESTCRAYCESVGIQFQPSMLKWDSPEDRQQAERAFQKQFPIHTAAIQSTSIISPGDKTNKKLSDLEQDAEWTRIFGIEGARVIRENVDANLPHYEYLKQFEMKV